LAADLRRRRKDVVEPDQPARSNEGTVGKEVLLYPVVGMVAIDEEELERLPAKFLALPRERLGRV
jgi:hypothetical protein